MSSAIHSAAVVVDTPSVFAAVLSVPLETSIAVGRVLRLGRVVAGIQSRLSSNTPKRRVRSGSTSDARPMIIYSLVAPIAVVPHRGPALAGRP